MSTFSEQLTAIRKERGITQEQLAQALSVSRTTISRWESAKAVPDIETIKQLSRLLQHNFFPVAGMEEEAPAAAETQAPAEPPAPNVPPAQKPSWLRWTVSILALGLMFLLGWIAADNAPDARVSAATNTAPATAAPSAVPSATPTSTPSADTGRIAIHASETEAYLKVIAVEDGREIYGWHVDFLFENTSDIPIQIEAITGYYYQADILCAALPVTMKDLRPFMTSDKLVRGEAPVQWSFSSNMLNHTHLICTITGVDDNGRPIEESVRVEFHPERAK